MTLHPAMLTGTGRGDFYIMASVYYGEAVLLTSWCWGGGGHKAVALGLPLPNFLLLAFCSSG